MKEAMKLALEALEGVLDNSPKVLDASISGGLYEVVQCRDAITAIKEALAQEQEPEWYHGVDKHGCNRFYHKTEARTSEFNTPLYTTPPQRKPLTDEEIGAILEDPNIAEKHHGNWLVLPYAYSRAIEAKLKEKNV